MKRTFILRTLPALALIGLMALMGSACTDALDNDGTPQPLGPDGTPLPRGVVALHLNLPAARPTFTGADGGGEAWTRSTVPGIMVVPDGAATTRAVPGFEPTDGTWKEGDEIQIYLSMASNDISIHDAYHIYTSALRTASGQWQLQATADTYTEHYGGSTTTPYPHTQLPLLYTDAQGTVCGLNLPQGWSAEKVNLVASYIYYCPSQRWTYAESDQLMKLDLKPGAAPGTTPYAQLYSTSSAEYDAGTNTLTLDVTQNGSNPAKFDLRFSRLRIYLGTTYEGRTVQLRSYRFSYAADNSWSTGFYQKSPDHTYTATIDAQGNAYFYGYTYTDYGYNDTDTPTDAAAKCTLDGSCPSGSEGTDNDKRFVISLLGAPSTDGAHTILFEASPYAKIAMTGKGTSYAINGLPAVDAKKLDAEEITDAQLSAMTYAQYVTALVTAANNGKTLWRVMAKQDEVTRWNASTETILKGIKAALMDTNVSSKKIHINLPEFVGKIVDYTFKDCTTLASVSMPKATGTRSEAFKGCTSLQSVSLPEVTSISASASAFEGCTALESVDLRKAEGFVGNNAFKNCKALTAIDLPKVTSIGSSAFANCTNLISFNLPEVTTINSNAFQSCEKLQSIDLPELKTIPNDMTFCNCKALTSVSLPKATTLGYGTFYNCTALESISLPKATTLGGSTFGGCTVLTSISLTQPGAWVSIDYDLFGGFAPSAACTVQLAAGSYNVMGTDGTTWSPKNSSNKTAMTPHATSGKIYESFTSGSTSAPEVNSKISFTTASTPAP